MSRKLVDREEQGRLIAQTSEAISMITGSNYMVRSISGYITYSVITTQPRGWVCSCPDYVCRDVKCKHVYVVEFYRSQGAA